MSISCGVMSHIRAKGSGASRIMRGRGPRRRAYMSRVCVVWTVAATQDGSQTAVVLLFVGFCVPSYVDVRAVSFVSQGEQSGMGGGAVVL